MIPRITARQFEVSLQQGISARDSSADVTYGPIADWVVRPQAAVFEDQHETLRLIYQLLTGQSLNDLPNNWVDDFVANEQVIRSAGSASFVDLVFRRTSKPTADVPVPANFPVATEIDPNTGAQITFVTLQSGVLYAATADTFFNPETNKYELTITASSVNTGTTTRVAANRVKRPLRPLIGFDSVTNPRDSTGGLPSESNQDVGDRRLLRIQGTDLSTPPGISRFARQVFSNIQDAYVVYGNDPFLTRADFDAGAVDIWVLGSSALERTVTVPFPGKLVPIVLDRQPVVDVVSVSFGVNYTQGVDYAYVEDPGVRARSTKGLDAIVFLANGAAPAVGDPLTITYRYDNLVIALQSLFQQPTYKVTGADPLFRSGRQVSIAISGNLKVSAGDPQQVLIEARQALLDALNGTPTFRGYRLDQDVEAFDLSAILSRVGGIDNFTFTLLARAGQVGVADIPIQPNEYARLNDSNLSLTLV